MIHHTEPFSSVSDLRKSFDALSSDADTLCARFKSDISILRTAIEEVDADIKRFTDELRATHWTIKKIRVAEEKHDPETVHLHAQLLAQANDFETTITRLKKKRESMIEDSLRMETTYLDAVLAAERTRYLLGGDANWDALLRYIPLELDTHRQFKWVSNALKSFGITVNNDYWIDSRQWVLSINFSTQDESLVHRLNHGISIIGKYLRPNILRIEYTNRRPGEHVLLRLNNDATYAIQKSLTEMHLFKTLPEALVFAQKAFGSEAVALDGA